MLTRISWAANKEASLASVASSRSRCAVLTLSCSYACKVSIVAVLKFVVVLASGLEGSVSDLQENLRWDWLYLELSADASKD